MNSLVTYSLIFLIVIPIFGINFFLSIIGNVLLLFFLITLLLVLIAFLSFNFLKSKVIQCEQCGAISLGLNDTCMNYQIILLVDLTKKFNQFQFV